MLSYRSRQGADDIRVWRSLVSRLNGVQEASSSNLDTRTKKAETVFTVSAFLFSNGGQTIIQPQCDSEIFLKRYPLTDIFSLGMITVIFVKV